jgi:hypothetical protein
MNPDQDYKIAKLAIEKFPCVERFSNRTVSLYDGFSFSFRELLAKEIEVARASVPSVSTELVSTSAHILSSPKEFRNSMIEATRHSFPDSFFVFYKKIPMFFTKDKELIDISNYYTSLFINNRSPGKEYDYCAMMSELKKRLYDSIERQSFEVIEEHCLSTIPTFLHLPMHYMEDTIVPIEWIRFIKKYYEWRDEFSKTTVLLPDGERDQIRDGSVLQSKACQDQIREKQNYGNYAELTDYKTDTVLYLDENNLFYKMYVENQLKRVYPDMKFLKLDRNKIYKFKSLTLVNVNHHISSNFRTQYVNRYETVLAIDSLNQQTYENVCCVKMKNVHNGSDYTNRCIEFEKDVRETLTELNYYLIDLEKEFHKKDYLVKNCQRGIFSWGSNHHINCNFLNINEGKCFMVLCASGYEIEFQRYRRTKNTFECEEYKYSDVIEFGNFVRYIYDFKDRRLNKISNALLKNLVEDFHTNFPFTELCAKIKRIKENNDFSFLDDIEEFHGWSREKKRNRLLNDIGYLVLENMNENEKNFKFNDITVRDGKKLSYKGILDALRAQIPR